MRTLTLVLSFLNLALTVGLFFKMTQNFDTLNPKIDALAAQNATLVALAADIKAKLDAAIAGGTGMTPEEVQTLADKIDAVTASDAAAVAADTPAG